MTDDHHADPITDDYDTVTARDIADLLHHLADLRHGEARSDDPTERAAFLARKAELFTRIADQSARRDPAYSEQVRNMATDARAATDHADPELPQQRVGPNDRSIRDRQPDAGGATSEEKTGASSG